MSISFQPTVQIAEVSNDFALLIQRYLLSPIVTLQIYDVRVNVQDPQPGLPLANQAFLACHPRPTSGRKDQREFVK